MQGRRCAPAPVAGPKKEKPGGKAMATAPPAGTALKTRKPMVASVSAPVVGLSNATVGCAARARAGGGRAEVGRRSGGGRGKLLASSLVETARGREGGRGEIQRKRARREVAAGPLACVMRLTATGSDVFCAAAARRRSTVWPRAVVVRSAKATVVCWKHGTCEGEGRVAEGAMRAGGRGEAQKRRRGRSGFERGQREVVARSREVEARCGGAR